MVIVASEPRETAYWEAWEEAYVNRQVLIRQLQNITCSFAVSVQRQELDACKNVCPDLVRHWVDGPGGCREAGGWMPWLKEKAGMTGRRWRTVLFGRKTVKRFLKTEVRCCTICCSPGPVHAIIK
jgi:hypothetical protein